MVSQVPHPIQPMEITDGATTQQMERILFLRSFTWKLKLSATEMKEEPGVSVAPHVLWQTKNISLKDFNRSSRETNSFGFKQGISRPAGTDPKVNPRTNVCQGPLESDLGTCCLLSRFLHSFAGQLFTVPGQRQPQRVFLIPLPQMGWRSKGSQRFP